MGEAERIIDVYLHDKTPDQNHNKSVEERIGSKKYKKKQSNTPHMNLVENSSRSNLIPMRPVHLAKNFKSNTPEHHLDNTI